jgi:hypothetical protein
MEKEFIDKVNDEVKEIIKSRHEFIQRHYLSVRDAYQNLYDWPELDPLRHEICLCLTFGLCQAAITLTNHFLESLLKYSLIVNHARKNDVNEKDIDGKVVSSLIEYHREGFELYNNADLATTINRSCSVGLISKEQKKELHLYREKFRNAFSHSDKVKTFGDSEIQVTGVKLEDDKLVMDEISQPQLAKFLVGQGLAQAYMAQNEAPKYFFYVDHSAREIINKLFDSKNSQK